MARYPATIFGPTSTPASVLHENSLFFCAPRGFTKPYAIEFKFRKAPLMDQIALFHEDINDALRAVVRSLGGTKSVAVKLWPEKTIADAQSYLNDCLNNTRAAHLFPEQVLLMLRWARQADCHAAMQYIAAECGYEVKAIEPEDELAGLQRQYIEAVKLLASITPKIEQAQQKLKAVG